MTEAEWLTCSDPGPMLEYLRDYGLISDRKQRLLDCACVRRVWHLLTDERGRRAVEIAEEYADGLAAEDDLREAQAAALATADAHATLYSTGTANSYAVLSAAAGTAWEYRSGADPLNHAAESIAWEGLTNSRSPQRRLARTRAAEERTIQAAFLRDIVGNPFRPVLVDRCRLTGALIELAESIYYLRAFDRLPLVADALDKAGNMDAQLVAHCVLPGPHVRGCWALDLLLGK